MYIDMILESQSQHVQEINSTNNIQSIYSRDNYWLTLQFTKVIVVSRIRGTLMTTCSQDACEKIFPLAFYAVDSKNNAVWQYFFF